MGGSGDLGEKGLTIRMPIYIGVYEVAAACVFLLPTLPLCHHCLCGEKQGLLLCM